MQSTFTPKEQFAILDKWLGYYKNSAAQIRVFHCLEMKHPKADGVQRVRCYPFKCHDFQQRNITDPVFMMPVDAKDDFTLPEDTHLLGYGRVLLLFSCLVPGRLGNNIEIDLAFVKYFDLYKVKGNNSPCVHCTQICVLSTQCIFLQNPRTSCSLDTIRGFMSLQNLGMKYFQSTSSSENCQSCQILALLPFPTSTKPGNSMDFQEEKLTLHLQSTMEANSTTSTILQ